MSLHTEGLHTSDILLLEAVKEVNVVQSCILPTMTLDLKDVNSNTFYSKLQQNFYSTFLNFDKEFLSYGLSVVLNIEEIIINPTQQGEVYLQPPHNRFCNFGKERDTRVGVKGKCKFNFGEWLGYTTKKVFNGHGPLKWSGWQIFLVSKSLFFSLYLKILAQIIESNLNFLTQYLG